MNWRWDLLTARVIGTLALGYSVLGMILTLVQLLMAGLVRERNTGAAPYVWHFYAVSLAVNFFSVFGLVWGGIGLLRIRAHVIRFCNLLCCIELVIYFSVIFFHVSAIFSSNVISNSLALTPGVGGGAWASKW